MRALLSLPFLGMGAVVALLLSARGSPGDGGGIPSRVPIPAVLSKEAMASIRLGLRDAAGPKPVRERKIVRVTAKPFHVAATEMVWVLCTSAPAAGTSLPAPAQDPHDGWIHVYVTPKARR